MAARPIRLLLPLLLAVAGTAGAATAPADGAVRARPGGFEAYDAQAGQWRAPEAFWDAFAARAGGRDWGRGSEYPPYAEVGEFDTFRVEIGDATCLMQFFHTRWRRANDVQRWDDRFNTHGACARVFD